MKILKYISFLCLLLNSLIYAELHLEKRTKENNPGVFVNAQDVPMFSEGGNPLTGLKEFHLIPPLSFTSSSDFQKKVQKAIESELEKVGRVIHLSEHDMRGFGAGTILLIQIKEVLDWNNRQMPFSRVSIQVKSSASVNKTGVNAFAAIWSTNAFFQHQPDSANEDETVQATKSIVRDFVKNYFYANKNDKNDVAFYTYY